MRLFHNGTNCINCIPVLNLRQLSVLCHHSYSHQLHINTDTVCQSKLSPFQSITTCMYPNMETKKSNAVTYVQLFAIKTAQYRQYKEFFFFFFLLLLYLLCQNQLIAENNQVNIAL